MNGWMKSYSPVCKLPGTYRKNWVHQRDAGVLLLQAGTFTSGWSVMASDKSAAKMGQNSSMWTHTRTPIMRGKITEMLIYLARNNKICPSWNNIDLQQTNGTKLASRSGSQELILSLSKDWSIIIHIYILYENGAFGGLQLLSRAIKSAVKKDNQSFASAAELYYLKRILPQIIDEGQRAK